MLLYGWRGCCRGGGDRERNDDVVGLHDGDGFVGIVGDNDGDDDVGVVVVVGIGVGVEFGFVGRDLRAHFSLEHFDILVVVVVGKNREG